MYLVTGFYKIHAAGQRDGGVGGTLAHECATEAVNFYFYRLSSLYIEYAVLSVDESRGVMLIDSLATLSLTVKLASSKRISVADFTDM